MAEDNKKKKAGLIASGTATSRTANWFKVVDRFTKKPTDTMLPHTREQIWAKKTGSKTYGRTWVKSVDMIKEAGNPKGLRATTFNFKKGTLGHKLVGGKSLIFKEQGFVSQKNVDKYLKRLDRYTKIMGDPVTQPGRYYHFSNTPKGRAILQAEYGKLPKKPRLKSTYKFTNVVIGGGKKVIGGGGGYPKLKPGRPIGGSLSSPKRPVVSIHKGWDFVATNKLPYPDTKFRKKWIGTQHIAQGSKLGQAITSRGSADVAKMVRQAKPALKVLGKLGTGLSGVGTAWMTYDLVKTSFEQQKNKAPTKKQKIYGMDVNTSGKYGVDY